MKRFAATFLFAFASLFSFGQFYTGYYVSQPQVHSFDHFKIKQRKMDDSKIKGDLEIHAYCSKKDQLWEMSASFIEDENKRALLVEEYGEGKDIISVHFLKFLWDGNEWEYFLLGYLGEDKHRHFVIVEEIFNDETETELLELNRFDWVKAHHLSHASN